LYPVFCLESISCFLPRDLSIISFVPNASVKANNTQQNLFRLFIRLDWSRKALKLFDSWCWFAMSFKCNWNININCIWYKSNNVHVANGTTSLFSGAFKD
jgi:hypothetical protein